MTKMENVADIYPLTPTQSGILYHALRAPGSEVYYEQVRYDLHGALDAARLKEALDMVVDRHPLLRTLFVWEAVKEPLQVVRRRVTVPWDEHDWRERAPEGVAAALDDLCRAYRQEGFDLTRAPVIRVGLVRLGDDLAELIWNSHHILLDGWSSAQIFAELFAIYEALAAGQPPRLPPPRPFKDYVAWLKRQDQAAAERFWREYLDGFSMATPLTAGRTAGGSGGQQKSRTRVLPTALASELKALGQRERLTLNTFMQGTWAVLLGRYTGRDDVVFGATVSGRPAALPDVESIVGMFITALPMRVRLAPEQPLLPWLRDLQSRQLEMRQYEYSSLADIHRWSELPAGRALFDSILIFENYPIVESSAPRTLRPALAATYDQSNYGLDLMILPGETVRLKANFDSARLDGAFVERLLRHFETLLESLVADPQRRVGDLNMTPAGELEELQARWNESQRPVRVPLSLLARFQVQADRLPERTAIVEGGETNSFARLQRQSRRPAERLRAAGVPPQSTVALAVDSAAAALQGALAIMAVGGTCAPVPVAGRRAALERHLAAVGAAVLLTSDRDVAAGGTVGGCPVVLLDVENDAEQSGTPIVDEARPLNPVAYAFAADEGNEGFVVRRVHHDALLSRCDWQREALPVDADEACVALGAPDDIDYVATLWALLLSGTTVVIPPAAVCADPARLVRFLARQRCGSVALRESTLRTLVERFPALGRRLPQLTRWTVQGPLPGSVLRAQFAAAVPQGVLAALYRPVSWVRDVAWTDGSQENAESGGVILQPLDNTFLLVLGPGNRPAPVGTLGALFAGGLGLESQPGPKTTVSPGGDEPRLLLATGDRARRLPDGSVELLEAPRKAEPEAHRPTAEPDTARSTSAVEQRLIGIWQESLGVAAVGPDDDFFDLGGHSIMAVSLFSRIKREFNADLPISALFQAATPRQLGALLNGGGEIAVTAADDSEHRDLSPAGEQRVQDRYRAGAWLHLVEINAGCCDHAPFFCVHGAGGNVLNFRDLARYLGEDQPFYGLQAGGIDGIQSPHRSVDEMVTAYLEELLAAQPAGPYLLGGYSGGGVIAYEMARRLRADGADVPLLVLFDTFHPVIQPRRHGVGKHLTELTRRGPGYVMERWQERSAERDLEQLRSAQLAQVEAAHEIVPFELRDWQLTGNLYDILQHYPVPGYDGHVALLVATEVFEVYQHVDQRRGWDGLIADLEIIPTPGNHNTMVLEPHVPSAARALRQVLERSTGKRSEERAVDG